MIERLVDFYESPGGIVVEVGSRDGHDAKAIAETFEASRVVIVEASPYCYENIVSSYPEYDVFNAAIVGPDSEKTVDFWQVDPSFGVDLLGSSSVMYKPMYESIASKIRVPAYTMDELTMMGGIDSIEVLKIDVEGATYELLKGFTKLRMTRILHVESEHQQYWEGQKLYEDTQRFLINSGYEEVFFAKVWENQSDTIWLRKD